MKKVFIIVPSFKPTGPVKGAFALAHLISKKYQVTLLALKKSPSSFNNHASTISSVCLADLIAQKNPRRILSLIRYIKSSLSSNSSLISFCFSSDLFAFLFFRSPRSYPYVRGNLFSNYFYDYGLLGTFLAYFHYYIISFFKYPIVMSPYMASQLPFSSSSRSIVIPNFIDEISLSKYRISSISNHLPYKIIFLGSLSQRKQPLLALEASFEASKLLDLPLHLHFVGSGPLLPECESTFLSFPKSSHFSCFFHGHLDDPYEILAGSDLFLLPSLSEGISRASLESLFLGVPVLLRDVDSNSWLSANSQYVSLFSNESQLPSQINHLLTYSRSRPSRSNLLPYIYSQDNALKLLSTLL